MATDKAPPPTSKSAARSDSGPADPRSAEPVRPEDEVPAQINDLASQRRFNADKPSEHGRAGADAPPEGEHFEPASHAATGSSVSEANENDKTGPAAGPGEDATPGPLSRVRNDGSGQRLTTNQGVPVSQNQDSLKAGPRGPALLKDFILREKLTHFDNERIPERVVHARGSAAHGYFEAYESLADITRAAPFQEAGKITPVFARFSTVQGERGSKDTARDVRGFAVKFYTDEGNWDLVGNNMPVFFIQDAIKFPDLVHAVKPEPHHAMPQAASAHDTFWDFVSLMPESTHMLMWQMSDRAIPRSYRMMQGFGVHTFRLVNAKGGAVFVKFHWTPKYGVHSLVWDETVMPGIDFTNDPLLAGRLHSYIDTQLIRLGGPNFHEIPINAPVAPVHNNQREGLHRQSINRGRVAYEPNSIAGGCPFQAGSAGYVSFPEPVQGDEVRAKPEKFAEHFNQARLFYESQSEAEQRHIAAAFRFELSKVTIPAIRERTVAMLRNASEALAAEVAAGRGGRAQPAHRPAGG